MTAPLSEGAPVRRSAMREGAFTLMEVLIAIAIFSMAAIVLGAAYLNIINNYSAISRGTGEDRTSPTRGRSC